MICLSKKSRRYEDEQLEISALKTPITKNSKIPMYELNSERREQKKTISEVEGAAREKD